MLSLLQLQTIGYVSATSKLLNPFHDTARPHFSRLSLTLARYLLGICCVGYPDPRPIMSFEIWQKAKLP